MGKGSEIKEARVLSEDDWKNRVWYLAELFAMQWCFTAEDADNFKRGLERLVETMERILLKRGRKNIHKQRLPYLLAENYDKRLGEILADEKLAKLLWDVVAKLPETERYSTLKDLHELKESPDPVRMIGGVIFEHRWDQKNSRKLSELMREYWTERYENILADEELMRKIRDVIKENPAFAGCEFKDGQIIGSYKGSEGFTVYDQMARRHPGYAVPEYHGKQYEKANVLTDEEWEKRVHYCSFLVASILMSDCVEEADNLDEKVASALESLKCNKMNDRELAAMASDIKLHYGDLYAEKNPNIRRDLKKSLQCEIINGKELDALVTALEAEHPSTQEHQETRKEFLNLIKDIRGIIQKNPGWIGCFRDAEGSMRLDPKIKEKEACFLGAPSPRGKAIAKRNAKKASPRR